MRSRRARHTKLPVCILNCKHCTNKSLTKMRLNRPQVSFQDPAGLGANWAKIGRNRRSGRRRGEAPRSKPATRSGLGVSPAPQALLGSSPELWFGSGAGR